MTLSGRISMTFDPNRGELLDGGVSMVTTSSPGAKFGSLSDFCRLRTTGLLPPAMHSSLFSTAMHSSGVSLDDGP